MNNLAAGVWYDLREKQLWPVALGLLAAIVVVILLLPKGTKEVAEVPPATTVQQPQELQSLVKLDAATVEDSKLQSFSVRDPFRSLADIAQEGSTGSTTGTGTTGTGTTGTGTTGTGTTGTGTTGTGSTGTGTGSTGTGGGGTTTPPPPPATTKREIFTFRVNMSFNREGGRVRRLKNIDTLELIPDSDRPFLVFLGVTKSLRTAVFLVNDQFEVETEGRCEPSPATCTFLYLRTDSETDDAVLSQTADDGTVTRYEFQLDAINRVLADTENTSNSTDNRQSPAFAGGKKDSKKSDKGSKEPPPPFQPEFFAYGDE